MFSFLNDYPMNLRIIKETLLELITPDNVLGLSLVVIYFVDRSLAKRYVEADIRLIIAFLLMIIALMAVFTLVLKGA